MAISPRRTVADSTKAQENAEYANSIVEFPLDALIESMTLPEAFIIDTYAHLGADVLGATVSTKALTMRLNKAVFDDETEDYIFGSDALVAYIAEMRKVESRESAERVRLLRSARALLDLHSRGVAVNTIFPSSLDSGEQKPDQDNSPTPEETE